MDEKLQKKQLKFGIFFLPFPLPHIKSPDLLERIALDGIPGLIEIF
jgi:hypothetical protein